MEIFLFFLFIAPIFIWPLSHALSGNTRKTRALKVVFFWLLGIAAFLILVTAFEIHQGVNDRSEVIVGTGSILLLLSIFGSAVSLVIIVFVREKQTTSSDSKQE